MKILIICQHFYPEEFRINDISYELVKREHSVTVLTGLPNYPKGKIYKEYKWFKNRRQEKNGVKIKRSFLIGRGSNTIMMGINYICFIIMASLKAILMKKDFDIIYVYQISPVTMALPAILMKKIIKKPLIIHCLDQWPVSVTIGPIKKEGFLYKVLYKISKWIYSKANLITISSKSFEKYFKNELKLVDKKYIYWPSYAESNYENIQYKENDDFDMVFAGNIGPAQSVETIIECANVLKNQKDIKFHIIGDGLNKNACEKLCEKYNLTNVIFYGVHPVEKMPEFYSIADAFIITMVENEVVNATLPAKIQSYMLAGKAIIGAINGEVKEVLEEANCGICCDSLDYKGLSEIILKVYKDKELLDTWGKNGKRYYLENFEKDKCIIKLEEILNSEIQKIQIRKQMKN